MRVLSALVLVVLFAGSVAAEAPSLEGAEKVYERAAEKASAAYEREMQQAREELVEAYQAAIKDATRGGNLDEALMIKQKLQAFQEANPETPNPASRKKRAPIVVQTEHLPLESDFIGTVWYRFDWTGFRREIAFHEDHTISGSDNYKSWKYENGTLKILGVNKRPLVDYIAVNRYTLVSLPGESHFHAFIKKGVNARP